MWAEIRNTHYDFIECATYIDAWETDDYNEEGKVIAKVYDTEEAEYFDERARTDEYAQEVINRTIETIKSVPSL